MTENNNSRNEVKLNIKNEDGKYSVIASATGFEEQLINIDKTRLEAQFKRVNLIDQLLTKADSHNFDNEFLQTGRDLYCLFLQPYEYLTDSIASAINKNSSIIINICTNDVKINRLHWELLFHDEHSFLATSARFRVMRSRDNPGSNGVALSPGPLRILFMVCSPEDDSMPLLNYEKEEEIIVDAVGGLKIKERLHIDIAETGTLKELKEKVTENDYHIVHISGHGIYDETVNMGYLCMENDYIGRHDVDSKKLADVFTGCQSIRMIFISACSSGTENAAVTGIASSLLANGLPMVIGMRMPVSDAAATLVAGQFYENIIKRKDADHALQMARNEFANKYKGNFQWSVPTIFTRCVKTALIDWEKPIKKQDQEGQKQQYIFYGNMSHLKKGFIGRRREIREYLKELRNGSVPAISIIGPGGIGKSTLATRITDMLNNSGYMIIPVSGKMTADSLIDATVNALIANNLQEHCEYLQKPISSQIKITYIIANILSKIETIYLLDNFEDNLKRSAQFKEFENPMFKEFFRFLLTGLSHSRSRLIITCRYTIPGISENLIIEKTLKEMSFNEARKMMLYNRDYAGYLSDDNGFKKVREIFETIGGNPKAIEELGKILGKGIASWEELKTSLDSVTSNMREFTIFKQLYEFLGEDEQSFYRKISVYETPFDMEAVMLQEKSKERTADWLKKLVNYSLLQCYSHNAYDNELYEIHPLNRNHLKGKWKDKDEKQTAHKNASEYYIDLMKKDANPNSFISAVIHLGKGCLFQEMTDLIFSFSNEMIKKGFWDNALYLFQLILDNAEHVSGKDIGRAFFNIGLIYTNKGEWDKALECYFKDEKISKELGDKARLGGRYNNIGAIYAKKCDWDKALEYYSKSESIHLIRRDKAGLGTTYNNIGIIYFNKGNRDKALEYYLKSESICIEVGDRMELGATYNNLGFIYDNKGDRDKVLKYYSKSEGIRIEVGDRVGLGTTYNNIGNVYSNKCDWDKALEYYLKDEEISTELGDRVGLGPTYNNIGFIYHNKGDWDMALEYYLKSESIRIKVEDPAGLIPTFFNIGNIYIIKGEGKRGVNYIIAAWYIAVRLGDRYAMQQMREFLAGIINGIGEEVFMKIGERFCRDRGVF